MGEPLRADIMERVARTQARTAERVRTLSATASIEPKRAPKRVHKLLPRLRDPVLFWRTPLGIYLERCAKLRPAPASSKEAPADKVRVKVADIIRAVAAAAGLKEGDILGYRRVREHAYPRHVAIFIVSECCPHMSLPMIGRAFKRDHTTVMHARKWARRRIADPNSSSAKWYLDAMAALTNTNAPSGTAGAGGGFRPDCNPGSGAATTSQDLRP